MKIHSNNKPWFTKDIQLLRKKKNTAFIEGNKEQYNTAKYKLRAAIRKAKSKYAHRLEQQITSNDTKSIWQKIKNMTSYKKRPCPSLDSNSDLADTLNNFYGRFEQQPIPSIPTPVPPPLPQFHIQEEEVRASFRKNKKRKAAGPDGVTPAVLKHCAAQLAPIFTFIFNCSLSQCTVPKCFKDSVIIPVPKTNKISCLNDYRPIALTSVVMKSFERIILSHLKELTSHLMDSYQFAYRFNRSVEDTVNLALYRIMQHLESSNTYARILFIDFSSAFNTINLVNLFNKLMDMDIDINLCYWIHDFLSQRTQRVRMGSLSSQPLTLSTGAPQGCVLSPWLFSLYTNSLTSTHSSVSILKYADDTTIIGLITNNNEYHYREQVTQVATWCQNNNLQLNTSKTQELIVDFSRSPTYKTSILISTQPITITDSFKFLGTYISSTLKWRQHSHQIYKKANKRLFFLRQLKKFRVRPNILLQFYTAIIQSILTSSIIVWYGNLDNHSRKKLQCIIDKSSKIIGHTLPPIDTLYQKRIIQRAKKITLDPSHPAYHLFTRMPSGRRYRSLPTKSVRLKNSFFPTAVRSLNQCMI